VTEYRRIEVDHKALKVKRQGDSLLADDGRTFAIKVAHHLPPAIPTKIIAVHLNYESRTKEFLTKLPAAPTYFHKPITSLNSHNGDVIRPKRCKWLNYEGEIVIIIGKTCKDISKSS
jgi:5-oxopent-3-ene-1,2,5-tricarboxylate decarboxylase/2-hydroxyhepta-2,4-diene-1,7-dioate isomerase